jgi:hypothetical protein
MYYYWNCEYAYAYAYAYAVAIAYAYAICNMHIYIYINLNSKVRVAHFQISEKILEDHTTNTKLSEKVHLFGKWSSITITLKVYYREISFYPLTLEI